MIFNQNGIFDRVEQATEKHGQAKAREELELVLGEVQMSKFEEGLSGEDYENRLDNKIQEIGELLDRDTNNTNYQQVVVEGSIFLIDRSIPRVVEYIGTADGVVITASVSGNGGWFKQGEIVNVTITGKIKTYSKGSITNISATKGATRIEGFSIDREGKYKIDNITSDTTIVISAKDSNNKEGQKTIPITIKIDNIPPTLSEVTAKVDANRIKIKAIAIDNESGLKQINYSVQPTTVNSATGTLSSGQEITLTARKNENYTITFIAEDKAGNLSAPQSKIVETLGVIKHIQLDDGTLKEVNTLDVYGVDVTGYNCTREGINWQIFYIDEEDDHRVYLITKDYMAPPTNNSTVKLLEGVDTRYPKAYRFGTGSDNTGVDGTVLQNFNGNLETSPEIYNKFINNYLKEYKNLNASSSQPNLQATKLMLDQEMWSEYKGINADLAFGGPTLPLFQASYNDIAKTTMKLGIQQSGTGYQVNKGGGNFAEKQIGYGNVSTQNGIYFYGTPDESAYGYYLASPSTANFIMMVGADYKGELNYAACATSQWGFRPIVSLKTSIKFKANADGSYMIK